MSRERAESKTMLPKPVQSVLIIIVGFAMLGYFAYERSDWIGLKLDPTQRRGAKAKLVQKDRVSTGATRLSNSTTGLVMTVEYAVDGEVYRDDLGIHNFRGGVNSVQIGQTVPILYNASDPGSAILASDLSPGPDDWAALVLGLCFIGLGIAQWGDSRDQA